MNLPENMKIVDLSGGPVTTNGGVTGDYISMKNVKKAWIVCKMTQAVGHATGIDPKQASAVDGTGVKALDNAVPIWANEDIASSDVLVRQTDAVTYNVTNDVKKKIVIFEIDPALFDQANGFDVLGIAVDDSSQATNFIDITVYLDTRYKSDSPPAAITD